MAPDLSAKKTQSRNNLTKRKKDKRIEERLCHYWKSPEKEFSRDLRRPTLSGIRMEYMSFDGTVTTLLRVVAPETPETIDGF